MNARDAGVDPQSFPNVYKYG